MSNWWQQAYPGEKPPGGLIPLTRPLYPPDAAGSGKQPSADGKDVEAIRRGISRGGRAPWGWATGDNKRKWSNTFAHGAAGGNVSESGAAGFQRQQGIPASGWWGTESHNALQYAIVPAGLPHAGEHLLDETALRLLREYADEQQPQPAGKLNRKAFPSPNYSSRSGQTVRLIVIHTAEGATTIESLGNFFASSSANASSHVGIDDKGGMIGEYVKRANKAWTAASANPVAVQAELCAFAKWTSQEWGKHPNMLENCARWIAEEAAAFDIPLTKLTSSQAQGSGRGVCQHEDLGSWGGGHWDCGTSFPIDQVISRAKELT